MNKKDLLHQAIDQLTNLEKAAPEYRWENRAIGQGHYFTDLWDCIQSALTFSRTRPHLRETLLIEQFRPERKELLLIQNGSLYTTQTPPREKETSEEDRKLKAAVLTIERLRKFFDGPNFVQADLTRDAFYKIITAAKLEANEHQEKVKTLAILGKKRQLKGAPGNWYLAEMKDVDDVGIYGALPATAWEDEDYLNSIRVPKGTSEQRKEQKR